MTTRTGALRCIVIFINTAFLAAGLTSLAMGIWLYITNEKLWDFAMVAQYVDSESLRHLWLADVIFMAAGAAVVVFGFVGVCGVWARNSGLWGFHAVCMTLAIGAHIAALVFVIMAYDKHQGTEQQMLSEFIHQYDGYGGNGFSRTFNHVQEEYKCCGVSGVTDFQGTHSFSLWNQELGTMREVPPHSCVPTGDITHTKGCHSGLNNIVFNHFVAIVVLSSVSIFCGLLLFALSLCLCVRYQDKEVVTHL